MRSMAEAKLKPPRFAQEDNYFVVTIEHTPLARPQEIVLQYLESHHEITNAIATELTGINSENTMKEVFYDLRDTGSSNACPGRRATSLRGSWSSPTPAKTTEPDQPQARVAEDRALQPRRLTRAQRMGKKR